VVIAHRVDREQIHVREALGLGYRLGGLDVIGQFLSEGDPQGLALRVVRFLRDPLGGDVALLIEEGRNLRDLFWIGLL